MLRKATLLACLALLAAAAPRTAPACPFCSSVSQTFTEEMNSMDIVVIAKLTHLAPAPQPGVFTPPQPSTFRVVRYLKGEGLLETDIFQTLYVGEGKPGDQFFALAIDPANPIWSVPLPVNDRVIDYLTKLSAVPEPGVDRLRFFQDYLEDEDELLARDAYDEFALAPYSTVQELGSYMDRDQILAWIDDPNVPASRRRLYLTMLSVCGTQADLPRLEHMLHSEETQYKAGLDAMIACYLTLTGPQGLPLIEDLFLKTREAEAYAAISALTGSVWQPVIGDILLDRSKPDYADTYSAIMALRFHGTDADVLEREDILHSMHYMLDRPDLADLVIPDLARWEDWSVAEQLFEMFRDADDSSMWVRVPIVNYMRACPLPEAQEYLARFEEIDPEVVKRANTFFPRSGGPPTSGTPASSNDTPSDTTLVAADGSAVPASAMIAPDPPAEPEPAAKEASQTAAAANTAGGYARYRWLWLVVTAVGVLLLALAVRRPKTALPAGAASSNTSSGSGSQKTT